jgi:hypothetical protein
MKFDCEELSISDEEFGCTICFSEIEDKKNFEIGQSYNEIMTSIGPYISLQRTYPESEFESDYYYFESSDFDKAGELNDFYIELSRKLFTMNFEGETYEIQIDINDQKFEHLKLVLTKIANGKGEIKFLD